MAALAALAVVTAIVAAVRSTWSPCGESVLSTITPVSEPGRGNRWGVTASAFLLGSIIGGAVMGLAAAALTPLTSAASTSVALGAAALAGGLAAMLDWRSHGRGLPPRHRQLNDADSSALRGWVYGAWWGLQVGCGLATICMTAGVYLTFVLAALTGEPLVALGIATLFGFVRGLGVLPAGRLRDVESLRSFHRRMDSLDDPSRRMALAWLLAATAAAAGLAVGTSGAFAAALGGLVVLVYVGTESMRTNTKASTPSTIAATTQASRVEA